MKVYRFDRIVNGKVEEGSRLHMTRNEAEKEATMQRDADEEAGEYKISYMITPVEV